VEEREDDTTSELEKLRAFYKAVAHLTSNHDHIEISDDEGYAVVFPSKLGPELEKIDKEWWKNA
jgi:hypothetical protein